MILAVVPLAVVLKTLLIAVIREGGNPSVKIAHPEFPQSTCCN